jgi:DNA polymerase-3 subunit chi
VVVNLGAEAPRDWQALDRLIEVLSTDADDVDRGRARWRAYKAAGLNIVHHTGS